MQALNLDDYTKQFSKARAIKRHHHFYLGPTNSGKTYNAIQALTAASSGVYLAPLRLLAMEVRDRLMAAGVPCNLITGEERVFIENAHHTASTIEMMNPSKLVDVAIIDEIQMLQDPDRGNAWTAALVGVPARQVFVCGSNAVTKPCIAVIESLGETYEMTQLTRKTPLLLEEVSLCGKRYSKPILKKNLQTGDCVIAFSRKDVLTFAARFRHWGFNVATIYGALSPEVRRYESDRFNSGSAQILVATDAIGMGLNLPIRRVIFANIHKYDGVSVRPLNATEVRQIAGRAGRFGQYETGYINVFENDERLHILHMLSTDDTAYLKKLPVAPRFNLIENIANNMCTGKIGECLEFFTNRLQTKHELFEFGQVNLQLTQALLVDAFAPKMSLRDKFTFVNAPVSLNLNIEKDYFLQCLDSVYNNKIRFLPIQPDWLSTENPKYLEIAEQLSQQISLYAWLSYQFPQFFVDGNKTNTIRQQVSAYITRALSTQAGYGETSREKEYR